MNKTNLVFVILIGTVLLLFAGCAAPPNDTTSNNATSNGITFTTSVSIGSTKAIPAATSGNLYNAKIIPSGGDPPYNCSAAPGTSLPGDLIFTEPGCSITGTAPILSSGTPTKVFPISFIIIDSNGTIAGPFHLDLLVNQQVAKLKLPETINTAEAGAPYQYNFCDPATQSEANCGHLAATVERSGSPPYTFTASGLPLGLSMNMNGLLSGTVPEGALAKVYDVTVCIRDMVATETCANTKLPVIARQQPLAPRCPYEGLWKGTVSASGTTGVGYAGATKPYSVNFNLEITLTCNDEYTNEFGKKMLSFNITRVKASDPFFDCIDGCTPVAGDSTGWLTFLELADDRKTFGMMAIRFPNNVLIQVTHTLLSADGKQIIDEVSSWPPYASQSIAWEVGSTRLIETYACSDCFNAYPDRTRIELTRVG